jgi:hypothetical protein
MKNWPDSRIPATGGAGLARYLNSPVREGFVPCTRLLMLRYLRIFFDFYALRMHTSADSQGINFSQAQRSAL